MKPFRHKSSKHKAKSHAKAQAQDTLKQNEFSKSSNEMNIESYIGQTVTVFVSSGGMSGSGFTGVLMDCSDCFVRLLITPSVPPACSLKNSCISRSDNIMFCMGCPFNDNRTVGSIAEISKESIVALVHNNLNSN